MPEVKSYKPGMFSWTDLNTPDVASAKKFYGELFGWKVEDMPSAMGPYGMAKLKGKDVAGISGLSPDMAKQGMPPHWNTYFTVASVDESAKRATSLGGKLMMPPMDAEDAGRMAAIADPSGATFCIWQGKKHMGAALTNEAGAINWAELATKNVNACKVFYSELFGWKPEDMPMPDMTYTVMNDAAKEPRAGIMPMTKDMPPQMPSHWVVYFSVADCDQSAKKVQSLGGKLLVPPTDIPNVGKFAICADQQGAFFAIMKPAPRS